MMMLSSRDHCTVAAYINGLVLSVAKMQLHEAKGHFGEVRDCNVKMIQEEE